MKGALPKRISVRERGGIFFIEPFNNFRIEFLRPMAVTKCVKNGVILLTVDAKRVFFETKEMQFSSCNNYSVQKFEIKFSQFVTS